MFAPRQDYILVKPIERKQSDLLWVTPEKYSRGLVVAVGPGKWLKRKNGSESGYFQTLTVKPGDFITYGDLDWIFPKYEEKGITYRILQEADVTFIGTREQIDEFGTLNDAAIQALIALHNPKPAPSTRGAPHKTVTELGHAA